MKGREIRGSNEKARVQIVLLGRRRWKVGERKGKKMWLGGSDERLNEADRHKSRARNSISHSGEVDRRSDL